MTNSQSYADETLSLTPVGSRLHQPPILSSYTFWSRPWSKGRLEAAPSKQVWPELGHPVLRGGGLLAGSLRTKAPLVSCAEGGPQYSGGPGSKISKRSKDKGLSSQW